MPIFKRWYFLLFVLIFSLVAGIWLARVQLAELVVLSAMKDMGLVNVATDIQQLDIDQCTISRLSFSLPTETGLLHFVAQDMDFSYVPEKLSRGLIDSLVLGELVVEMAVDGPGKVARPPDNIAKVIKTLRHALREYLFVNTLLVRHLTLSGDSFGVLRNQILRLKSTTYDETLSAEVTLLGSATNLHSGHLSQLVINRLTGKSLNLELRRVVKNGETYSAVAGNIAARLDLDIHDMSLDGSYQLEPKSLQPWLQTLVDVSGLDKIERVSGKLSFDFSSNDRITSMLSVVSDKLIYSHFDIDNVAIKLKLKTETASFASDRSIHILNGSSIKMRSFKYDRFSFKDSRIYVVGQLMKIDENWSYRGGFGSSLFAGRYEAQSMMFKDVAARITASSEKLDISGTFSPKTVSGKFSLMLEHDFVKHLGKLSVKPLKPLELTTENSSLGQLFTQWPYSFDIFSGKVRLSADADWSRTADFSLMSEIDVEDAGGHVGELVFSGLGFTHELKILPLLNSIKASKITLAHVDGGVSVSDVSAAVAIKTAGNGLQPEIVLRDLHGKMLGGSISSSYLIYDPNKTKNTFKIVASDIDLAKIVQTQKLSGMTATGKIGGYVIAELNEKGVSVADALFTNNAGGGTIRYVPAAGAGQLKKNPLTGMALDALKDFRYSFLSAGVTYIPDGTLTVDVHLKGKSLTLDANRPVNLNINTEQNLLALLKSIRYTNGISGDIDTEVRRQFEKKKKYTDLTIN